MKVGKRFWPGLGFGAAVLIVALILIATLGSFTTKPAVAAPVLKTQTKTFSGCADVGIVDIRSYAPGVASFAIVWNQTKGTNKFIKIETGAGAPRIVSTSEFTGFFGTLNYQGPITVSTFIGNESNTCWERTIVIDPIFPNY